MMSAWIRSCGLYFQSTNNSYWREIESTINQKTGFIWWKMYQQYWSFVGCYLRMFFDNIFLNALVAMNVVFIIVSVTVPLQYFEHIPPGTLLRLKCEATVSATTFFATWILIVQFSLTIRLMEWKDEQFKTQDDVRKKSRTAGENAECVAGVPISALRTCMDANKKAKIRKPKESILWCHTHFLITHEALVLW